MSRRHPGLDPGAALGGALSTELHREVEAINRENFPGMGSSPPSIANFTECFLSDFLKTELESPTRHIAELPDLSFENIPPPGLGPMPILGPRAETHAEIPMLSTATDLSYRGFSGLLPFLAHVETLLEVPDPVKCLLE